MEFIGTQNTSTNFNGWLRFNATNAVMLWTHYSYSNNGLYISVHSLDNESNFNISICIYIIFIFEKTDMYQLLFV